MGKLISLSKTLAPVSRGRSKTRQNAISELSAVQVSRRGDLWNLGKQHSSYAAMHWLDVITTLLHARFSETNLVFQRPSVHVHNSRTPPAGNGKVRHKDLPHGVGEMTVAELTNFLTDVLTLVASYSRQPSLHFTAMDWRHVRELLSAGDVCLCRTQNVCVWVKDNPGWISLS